MISTKL